MRPIKKSLLIHDISLRRTQGDFFGESVEEEIPITRVRVEPKSYAEPGSTLRTQGNMAHVSSSVIFIDAVHSAPFKEAMGIKVGDKIVFEGRDLRVIEVNAFYGRRLHHLEILCEG